MCVIWMIMCLYDISMPLTLAVSCKHVVFKQCTLQCYMTAITPLLESISCTTHKSRRPSAL